MGRLPAHGIVDEVIGAGRDLGPGEEVVSLLAAARKIS